jgi:hypothetical protein
MVKKGGRINFQSWCVYLIILHDGILAVMEEFSLLRRHHVIQSPIHRHSTGHFAN